MVARTRRGPDGPGGLQTTDYMDERGAFMKHSNGPSPRLGFGLRTVVVLALGLLLSAVAVGAGLAGGGNSANAKACQKGGWMRAQTGTGDELNFADQSECVEFGARGGVVFGPFLKANP